MTDIVKRLTGFAILTPEQRRDLAQRGQAALKASGRRHRFTSETARAAATVGWARRKTGAQ